MWGNWCWIGKAKIYCTVKNSERIHIMKKKLIAGNWKMNGSLAANSALVAALDAGLHVRMPAKCEVALCVPSVYLA